MIGSPGRPQPTASVLARPKNSSVQMAADGMFCFSSSIRSWIHHDVHEPQSQIAPTTASQPSMNSEVKTAGCVASFRNQRKSRTPKDSASPR